MFDMFKITTLKKQKISLSDPILIRQFSIKLQSGPVPIRPKLASVLIQSDPVLIRARLYWAGWRAMFPIQNMNLLRAGGLRQKCTESEFFDPDSTPASAEYTPT